MIVLVALVVVLPMAGLGLAAASQLFKTFYCLPNTVYKPSMPAMSQRPHYNKAPPEYPYTHAYSAYSALVQLYARSGQFPTADVLYSRGKLESPQCRHGCNTIEDQHHVFVKYERYAEWRSDAGEDIHTRTDNKLQKKASSGKTSPDNFR